ncbi:MULTISPECIES: MFS transporter [Paenibacillus]|uniref:MFS transporter n=1 Tax=Paenibacillus TaxID=44249 RepID=UPI0003E1E218|nr:MULTISPECIES: MFS transporter [Paenibacillus]ETT43797.1 major facilitator family transporter [Paenibacillus sp. FSL H7-689]OMF42152.1 arabinose ABC transporter permease [Paenibacillus amylolyticus]
MSKRNNLFIFILTLGVFGILNTEMGVIGILPQIAEQFNVSVSQAGLLVSLFALAVAISGPILPLVFSRFNRRGVMLLVLGVFVISNIFSIFATNFTFAIIARVIPAFLHPVYISIALTAAASSVSEKEIPKAVSKVIMGVSAGIVLGVPITTFIASIASIDAAMTFFAIVNAVAFIGVLLFVPSMPVRERLSYGSQLRVLKKAITWQSIVAVIFVNAATAGVYSYFAEYLATITHISGKGLSLMLVIFGAASLFGNVLGGRLLSKNAIKSVMIYPFVFGVVYIFLFFMGQFTVPMFIIVVIWGVLYAIASNISQYWITSAAPEAPEFANGLFLTSGNLGVTIGTTVGGLFISGMGVRYIVVGGLLFLILSLAFILLRIYMYTPKKQISH